MDSQQFRLNRGITQLHAENDLTWSKQLELLNITGEVHVATIS